MPSRPQHTVWSRLCQVPESIWACQILGYILLCFIGISASLECNSQGSIHSKTLQLQASTPGPRWAFYLGPKLFSLGSFKRTFSLEWFNLHSLTMWSDWSTNKLHGITSETQICHHVFSLPFRIALIFGKLLHMFKNRIKRSLDYHQDSCLQKEVLYTNYFLWPKKKTTYFIWKSGSEDIHLYNERQVQFSPQPNRTH